MPDLLKITTPVVNKADTPSVRQAQDAVTAFDLQNIQKVVKPEAQAELLKQNNGMLENPEAPAILMNLLKDPSVTVGVLKNIFMLQEIIGLLPVNNTPLTPELEQMFGAMLVRPEDIVAELLRQEDTSTMFKGELFDFLRAVIAQPGQTRETTAAVATLLKALNNYMGNQDILDAVANTLQYLGQGLEPSRELSGRLLELSSLFRRSEAPEQFQALKQEVLSILKEVEESILYSPKMQKVSAITVYNLSRYNDNPSFLQESISNLLINLDARQRQQFQRAMASFLAPSRRGQPRQGSSIMDILAQIIGKEAKDKELTLVNSEKIERIIHSLLSSPCNFTPLLHYVVPVQYENMRAFAELWINPNGQEDEKEQDRDGERNIHMLVVFDLEGIGRFETELYVREQTIDLSLFCPPPYVRVFERALKNGLSASMAGLSYKLGEFRVERLERTRSLMDVFKSLPYKRTGVNVKI